MKAFLKKLFGKQNDLVIVEMTEEDIQAQEKAHRGIKYPLVPVYMFENNTVAIYFVDLLKGEVR